MGIRDRMRRWNEKGAWDFVRSALLDRRRLEPNERIVEELRAIYSDPAVPAAQAYLVITNQRVLWNFMDRPHQILQMPFSHVSRVWTDAQRRGIAMATQGFMSFLAPDPGNPDDEMLASFYWGPDSPYVGPDPSHLPTLLYDLAAAQSQYTVAWEEDAPNQWHENEIKELQRRYAHLNATPAPLLVEMEEMTAIAEALAQRGASPDSSLNAQVKRELGVEDNPFNT